MADVVCQMTGLEIDKQGLRDVILRVYLRGYANERRQGFTEDDYSMPAEIHEECGAIDLPHFNTAEFFTELKGKVLARFDEMARAEGLLA